MRSMGHVAESLITLFKIYISLSFQRSPREESMREKGSACGVGLK